MTIESEKSLYERLGSYDAIAAATDDLLQRLTSDPDLGFYWRGHSTDWRGHSTDWRGHSTDSMKPDRQLLVNFLCESIGGPSI